jgi:hypothetical protein
MRITAYIKTLTRRTKGCKIQLYYTAYRDMVDQAWDEFESGQKILEKAFNSKLKE